MAWWDEIDNAIGNAGAALGGAIGGVFGAANSSGNTIGQPAPISDPGVDPTVSNGYAPFIAAPSDMMISSGAANPATSGGAQEGNIARIMAFGYDERTAQAMLQRAALGDTAIQKTLATMGVEPYAMQYAPKDSSGSGGGSSGRVLFPEEVAQVKAETDRILAQTGIYQGQARQINALFDPNYPDGALITLPDGTQRINGTEIIIDSRVRGDFKPVSNAPGYFVDPVTGTVIDTNGNQIRREELQETIRSNQAQETNQRNRLALDTELGITGLNQNAAITENEQKLKSALETNRLNLDAFSSEGNLNIGATNAETSRLNALTGRTSAAGELSLNKQQLDDARVARVIELASNPQNFVQREYETRALQAPAGINSPAYKENTAAAQAIADLLIVPDVSGLLPTYTAPRFTEPVLPNASIPRATAPTYETPPPVSGASSTPAAPVNNTPATQQQASDYFRNVTDASGNKIPDWALTPLGYAEGTEGTTEREFIAGDPQSDGGPNPEIVQVHNPGPNTTASVTPIKDMMTGGQMMPNDQMVEGQGTDIHALVDAIVSEVMAKLGMGEEVMSEYAYGTDWGQQWQRPQNNSQPNESLADNLFNNRAVSQPGRNITRPTNRPQGNSFNTPTTSGQSTSTPNNIPPMNPTYNAIIPNWQDVIARAVEQFQQLRNNPPEWAANIPWMQPQPVNDGQGDANIQPVPNTNPWGLDLSRLGLPMFARGTDDDAWLQSQAQAYINNKNASGLIGSRNFNTSGQIPQRNQSAVDSRFGPKDSQGNYLGKITSNTDQAIQNMPNVQYAKNYGNQVGYNQLGTGNVGAAFGVNLPDVGGLNLRQLNDIRLDPDAWGTLSSLYSSGNRNLEAIYNRVLANAPRGNALPFQSMIRT